MGIDTNQSRDSGPCDRAVSEVPSALWRSRDVAAFLDVSEATLARWRRRGIGPACIQIDGIARYRPVTVEAWLDSMEASSGRAESA